MFHSRDNGSKLEVDGAFILPPPPPPHGNGSSCAELFVPILLPNGKTLTPGGGGEVLLEILGGGVPPDSLNPNPISHQKCHFSHPFSDLASNKYVIID